jgi:hypothetical protein
LHNLDAACAQVGHEDYVGAVAVNTSSDGSQSKYATGLHPQEILQTVQVTVRFVVISKLHGMTISLQALATKQYGSGIAVVTA